MKKRLFLFILALFFVLPAAITLVACGGNNNNNGGGDNTPSIQPQWVSVEYNGTTYQLDSETNRVEYTSGINFVPADFSVVVYMSDGSSQTVTSDDVQVEIYKVTYDEQGQVLTPATTFDTGAYIARVNYPGIDTPGDFYFFIDPIDISTNTNFAIQYTFDNQAEETCEYTGSQIEPAVAITFNGQALVANVDYEINYNIWVDGYGPVDNTNVSTGDTRGHIYIQGKGNFGGAILKEFRIVQKVLPEITVKHETVTLTYGEQDNFSQISASSNLNNTEHFYDFRYIITKNAQTVYDNTGDGEPVGSLDAIINVGTYQITYVPKWDESSYVYEYGNPTATLVVNPADISNYIYDITYMTKEYRGYVFTAEDFDKSYIGLKKDADASTLPSEYFEVEMASEFDGHTVDNLNASHDTTIGAIVVTGAGNYTGSQTIPYTITKRYFSNATVELTNSSDLYLEYNGNSQQPAVTAKLHLYYDDNLQENVYLDLVEGTDYTISYPSDTTNVGEKIITITGMGNFNGEGDYGSQTVYYYITKKQIALTGYEFAHQTTTVSGEVRVVVTYNGQNQSEYMLALNNNLPEQVEVVYTYDTYQNNATQTHLVGALINANVDSSYNGGLPVKATFRIKQAYASNYELNTLYDNQEYITANMVIEPFVVGSPEVYTATTISGFDGGEGTNENPYYYTYNATARSPKVTITTTFNGESLTLVEGTHYTLGYSTGWGETQSESVTNAGDYYVFVTYIAGENNYSNFCQSKGTNGAYMTYNTTSWVLRFNINKATLSASQLSGNWPEVKRLVWSSYAYFDETEKTTTCEQTIVVGGEEIDATFTLVKTERWGEYRPYVDENKRIYISFSSQNYTAENALSETTLVNPFTSFSVNNVELSDADLDNLTVKYGDTISFTAPEGYDVLYYETGSYGHFSQHVSEQDSWTKVLGGNRNDDTGEFIQEYNLSLTLYETGEETPVASKECSINQKAMFSLYGIYTPGTPDVEPTDILEQNGLEWSVQEGQKLKITMDYAGYKLSYHTQNLNGTDSSESAWATSMDYTALPNDKAIVVSLYNSIGQRVMTVYHNVSHDYREVFAVAGVWKTDPSAANPDIYLTWPYNPIDWENILVGTNVLEVGYKLKFTIAPANETDYKFSLYTVTGNTPTQILDKVTTGEYTIAAGVEEINFILYRVYNSTDYVAQDVHLVVARDQELMTLYANPAIELIIGRDNKVASANAINDEGNYILNNYTFTGLTAEQAAAEFVSVLKECGYVVPGNSADLTIGYTGSQAKRNRISGAASERGTSEGLNLINYYQEPLNKEDIVETLREGGVKEFTVENLNAMSQAELLEMLASLRGETSTFKNNYIKELYALYRAEQLLTAKFEVLATYDETNADSITTILTSLDTAFSNMNSMFVAYLLKSSSPLVLAEKALAELKMNILSSKANGQPISESLQTAYNSAAAAFASTETSMHNMLQQLTGSLTDMFDNLDELVDPSILSAHQADIDSAIATAKTNIVTDFLALVGRYNKSCWYDSEMIAEGTQLYVYHENEWTTYSFNRDEIVSGVYSYVVYLYNGNVTNFASVNPYTCYSYTLENDRITFMEYGYLKQYDIVDGEIVEHQYDPYEGTITVEGTTNYYCANQDMGVTLLFNTVGDNKVVYIFLGYHEQAQLEGMLANEQYTWAVDPLNENVVYMLMDDTPLYTFDIVAGQLVWRVIVPEGNKVYFCSVEGYIMTLLFNDNNKVYIYNDTLTEEQAEQTYPALEGTWVQQDNLITITVGGEPFFMSFTVDGSTLTPVI